LLKHGADAFYLWGLLGHFSAQKTLTEMNERHQGANQTSREVPEVAKAGEKTR
jgi:hypothetical protein